MSSSFDDYLKKKWPALFFLFLEMLLKIWYINVTNFIVFFEDCYPKLNTFTKRCMCECPISGGAQ